MASYESFGATGAHTRPAFAGWATRTLRRAVSTVQAWRDESRTRNALLALSERELDDIGLTRGDIEAVVRGERR